MCHSVVFSVFPVLGNCPYHLIANHCPHPQQKSHAHSPLSSNPWQPLIYSLSLRICQSGTCAQMESCSTWPVCWFWASPTSQRVPALRSFRWLTVHPSVDEYLCCFYFLAIMNITAMPVCAQVSMWTFVFNSLGVKLPGQTITLHWAF